MEACILTSNSLFDNERIDGSAHCMIAVPQSIAQQYHLKTISDLAPVSSKLTLGAEPEYYTRPEYHNMINTYKLNFGSNKRASQ